jgi:hypothetical protein
MSTPIAPGCKLEGLELYAPRRVRTNPVPEGPDSPSRISPHEGEDDRWWAEAESAAEAHARVDEAIQTAIDVGRSFCGSPPLASAAPAPQSTNSIISQGEAAKWPPSSSDPFGPGRRLAQIRARRRSGLDPEIVPEPPIGMQRGLGVSLLVRFALVVGVAAIVAYGLAVISSPQPDGRLHQRAGDDVAAIAPMVPDDSIKPQPPARPQPPVRPQPPARLLVENKQAFANEPLSLGVSVDHATGHESLLLAGLTVGTRLSAGAPVSESSWQLPLRNLSNVVVYAPKDFVGVMNTAIDLLSRHERLMDSRAVRFEWVAKKSDPMKPLDRIDSGIPSGASVQPMDREQAAFLMKQGRDLLKIGDIAAARLAFRHLANAGNAEAALALGATFDPRFLAELNVIGVVGDDAKARTWYQRAMELGSTEAKRILARTATK